MLCVLNERFTSGLKPSISTFALDAQASIYSPAIRHAMRDQPRSNVFSHESEKRGWSRLRLRRIGACPQSTKIARGRANFLGKIFDGSAPPKQQLILAWARSFVGLGLRLLSYELSKFMVCLFGGIQAVKLYDRRFNSIINILCDSLVKKANISRCNWQYFVMKFMFELHFVETIGNKI